MKIKTIQISGFRKILKATINMEDDIYGHDVTVHFHGLYCNCQDGAAAFNYVIEAVDACASEEEV